MGTDQETRDIVRERYAAIATRASLPVAESCCSTAVNRPIGETGYGAMEGYVPEADLELGCGIPTAFASLVPGETVVDLGSGAGNDVFIAAKGVGPTGRVIGVDMTPEMISKARANAAKVGAGNVEFRLGEIEHLPLDRETADVVISNCVVNLVPDKRRAFSEIHRVLKKGGRFTISDVVLGAELPEPVRRSAEMWAGCVAGALPKEEYLSIARETGFEVSIEKERRIEVPQDLAAAALAGTNVRPEQVRLISITLTGWKR